MSTDLKQATETAAALVQRGDLPAAILEYGRLFEQNPGDWTIGNALGDLYLRHGRVDGAVLHFIRLAERLASDGLPAKARQLYRKILILQPSNATARQRVVELETQPVVAVNPSLSHVPQPERDPVEAARQIFPATDPAADSPTHRELPADASSASTSPVTIEPLRDRGVETAAAHESQPCPTSFDVRPSGVGSDDIGEPEAQDAGVPVAEALAEPVAEPIAEPVTEPWTSPILDAQNESNDEWAAVDLSSAPAMPDEDAECVTPATEAPSLSDEEDEEDEEDDVPLSIEVAADAPSGLVDDDREPAAAEGGECDLPSQMSARQMPIDAASEQAPETDSAATRMAPADAPAVAEQPPDGERAAEAVIADEPAADDSTSSASDSTSDGRALISEAAPPPATPTDAARISTASPPPVVPAAAPAVDTLWEWKDLSEAFEHTRRRRLEDAAAAAEERLAESGVLIENRQFEEAKRVLEAAACVPHLRCAASCRLADVHLALGAPLEALACLEWAARIAPSSKESGYELAYSLALTFEALGERSQALGIYRELAADAGPSYRDVVSRSERLASRRRGGA